MSELIKLIIIVAFVTCSNAIPNLSRTDARIIGGVDSPENYAIHMIALLYNDRPMCGGAIISEWCVLTAAHCTAAVENEDGTLLKSFYGRAGSLKWGSGGTIIHFAKHYKHPQYDEENIKYDIAIIKVVKPFVWSESIGMIGLDFNRVEEVHCYVTGWGRTGPKITNTSVDLSPTPDKLQKIYLNTINSQQCAVDMQYAFENNPHILHIPHICPEAEICTFHSRGHGMCHGDSGSGLVCRGRLVGVVSWGLPCAVGAPDVFVRISGMTDFVIPTLDSFNKL